MIVSETEDRDIERTSIIMHTHTTNTWGPLDRIHSHSCRRQVA